MEQLAEYGRRAIAVPVNGNSFFECILMCALDTNYSTVQQLRSAVHQMAVSNPDEFRCVLPDSVDMEDVLARLGVDNQWETSWELLVLHILFELHIPVAILEDYEAPLRADEEETTDLHGHLLIVKVNEQYLATYLENPEEFE